MTDTSYRNYLYLKEKEAELKDKIKQIEDAAEPFKADLAKCIEKKKALGDELIERVKKENIKTVVFEGHSIGRQSKENVKIVDSQKLLEALSEKYIAPLKRIIGMSYDELRESLAKPSELNTTKAREYIDLLIKVEQVKEIEGTEIQVTEYITVK